MERLIIEGGTPLNGKVKISGMKNGAVALLMATIIVNDVCILENVPDVDDVHTCIEILESIGASVDRTDDDTLKIDTTGVMNITVPAELMKKMRASYYIAGAMLARFGSVAMALPGGCHIGTRPIDQHIKAFEALGATAERDGENLYLSSYGFTDSVKIPFDVPTVGGTVNAVIAATAVSGTTVIENVALEPYVTDFLHFLEKCGADIDGIGTGTIVIHGGKELKGCRYSVVPDYIEAETYLIAGIATKGCVTVTGVVPEHIESVSAELRKMNAEVTSTGNTVTAECTGELSGTEITTAPYPGFPTDIQPVMAALMCLGEGKSRIKETMFESRLGYTGELEKMKAVISVSGNEAEITGTGSYESAEVTANDLRAGAALTIAALAASGTSVINGYGHIKRGYSNLVENLNSLGAHVKCENNTTV